MHVSFLVQTAAWANQKTESRLCKAAMLRCHHELRAKLSGLEKLRTQLVSADSPLHSHAKPMTSGCASPIPLDWQSASKDVPSSSENAEGRGLLRTYRQCKLGGAVCTAGSGRNLAGNRCFGTGCVSQTIWKALLASSLLVSSSASSNR